MTEFFIKEKVSERKSEKPENPAYVGGGMKELQWEWVHQVFIALFIFLSPAHTMMKASNGGKILHHYHQSLDNLHHHQWYCSENDLAMRGFLMGNVRLLEWCERLPVGSVSGKGGSFSLPPLPVPCQSTPCLKHWIVRLCPKEMRNI